MQCGVYVCIHMYSFGAYIYVECAHTHACSVCFASICVQLVRPYVCSMCCLCVYVCVLQTQHSATWTYNAPTFCTYSIQCGTKDPAGMNVLKRIVHASATWVGGSPAATLNLPYPYQELSVCFVRTTFCRRCDCPYNFSSHLQSGKVAVLL